MSIKNLQKSIHKDNLEAGWWDEKPASYATNTATSIALMHMELSKALEIVRKGGFVDFERISHKIKELSEEKNNDDMLVKISLMHSELSEALEYHISDEYDSHLPNRKGEEVELADLVIRLLDYAEKKRV